MIYIGAYQSSTCIFEIIIVFGRGFPRFKLHTDNTRVDWFAWCAEGCFFLSFGHTTISLSAAILKLFVHISICSENVNMRSKKSGHMRKTTQQKSRKCFKGILSCIDKILLTWGPQVL